MPELDVKAYRTSTMRAKLGVARASLSTGAGFSSISFLLDQPYWRFDQIG
jgi:hypothetical protein